MWIFGEWGLVMPVMTDSKEDRALATDEWTQGKYFLQVRGRMREHLEYFMENYMEPGTFTDKIQYVPTHDYVFRFYTTHEAFAQAVAKAVMDIDYRHFKDRSAKKVGGKHVFKRAEEYHKGLLGVWSATASFGQVGGFYGPWSPDNPRGYGKARRAHRGIGDASRPVGSTFRDWELEDELDDLDDVPYILTDDDFNWEPDTHTKIAQIKRALKGIPVEDWSEYLNDDDFAIMQDTIADELRKKNRKVEKQARKHYRRGKTAAHTR